MSGTSHILVIEARFYSDVADELLVGAKAALNEAKASYDVISVPGALEIPQVMALAIQNEMFKSSVFRKHYDGCVALGCVIRGETSHYDIVAVESARALLHLATLHGVPLGNGILTVENHGQAIARASVSGKNKGRDAVIACLDVLRIDNSFSAQP